MMGRRIRGSGWYPNFRQPQLFRKGSMRYTLEPVHEGYEALSDKPLGTLRNAIWQFPFRNLEEVIRKMNRYSSLGASKLAHKRVSMASAFGHAVWAFLKHYFAKAGLSTAGPASSLRLLILRRLFTATPSAMRRPRTGGRRRAGRSGVRKRCVLRGGGRCAGARASICSIRSITVRAETFSMQTWPCGSG